MSNEHVIDVVVRADTTALSSGLASGQGALARTRDSFSSVGAVIQRNSADMESVGKGAAIMGGAVLAGIGLAVKSYMEFDSAMAEVRASTHETAGNMELLREAAINAGADTAFSAKEAAQGIDELAKAGVSTKDILGGGLTGALSLAAAGSLGVGEAAEIAASALTQFKLSGDDIPHLADLLAAGAGKAQGSVQDMGAALNQAGLVAASTGLTIEETTGTLAAFASAGLTGSDAGTSFKTMLMSLNPNSKEAKKLMDELGISAYDSQGSFIGMSEYAGVLQGALKDMSDEQRNATLKTLFGSDAVRAANVLYEQGAEGISKWESAVNDAGYAAMTAAIKQDTLAGDLEKLGGSFDSVLIKGGGGAAESLRGLVQGLESMVDSLGEIPTPVMNAVVGIAALTGGALLLGGGIMALLPKIVAFRASQAALATAMPRTASAMGVMSKAAGIATVAIIALVAANAAFGDHDMAPKLEATTQAILKLQKSATTDGESGLDSLFKSWDSTILKGAPKDVDTLSDAVRRLANKDAWDDLNKGAGDLFSAIGGGSAIGQVAERIKSLGDAMGELTKNGAADTAAVTFRELTKEFEANGKGAKEALESVPGYKEALQGLGRQAGVVLEGQDLLDFAMGKVPASMNAAAAATEGHAAAAKDAAASSEAFVKGLEDVGLAADGSIVKIDAFAKSLFAAGLLSLSASDANIAYQDAIDKVTESVIANGKTLDIGTEKGRANQGAYNGLAKSAMAVAEAVATETLATQGSKAAQDQLQASLDQSYKDLVIAAGQFGITGDAADAMARKALGIPKDVPIKTWVEDKASAELDKIKGKADVLDGRQVLINIRENTHRVNYEQRVVLADGNEPDGGGLYGSDRGRAAGGPIYGSGPKGVDSEWYKLAPGEHVWTAAEVDAAGGQSAVKQLRSAALAGGIRPSYATSAPSAPAAMGGFGSAPFSLDGYTLSLNADATMATFHRIANNAAESQLNNVSRQVGGMRR